jgi:hypothetical protein
LTHGGAERKGNLSVQALSWVLDEVRGLKAPERIVLLVLANYADKDNASCWPSIKTIARNCELTPETIRLTIRKLEAKGLLRAEQTYRGNGAKSVNLYHLNIGGGAPPVPPGVDPSPPGAGEAGPEGGSHPPSEGGSTTFNRQSNHQSNRAAERAEDVAVPANLQTEKFLGRWAGWLDWRRTSKRIPVTARAAQMQLRELAEVGPEDACAAIDMAMMNDYQGLFPKKTTRRAQEVDPAMHNYGWGQR